MIEAVLIDYGGVFTPSPFTAVERLGAELGAAPGQLIEIVFGPYDRDTDHPWHRLERGELTFAAARAEILSLGDEHGLRVDLHDFLRAMGSLGRGVRQEVVEHVRALKRDGFRTAVVTNNVAEFGDHWRRTLPIDEIFDAVIDSCEVRCRKPAAEIFRLALARLAVGAPDRAVFLDDFHGNVAAARRFGMHGILVGDDPAEAFAELDRLLGR
jgi:epoxide hydrolase-like predicted phosphatase